MADGPVDRRGVLKGAALTGALGLSGCGDDLSQSKTVSDVLASAETLTYRVQRLLLGRHALAREFTEGDLSPAFRANGSVDPPDTDYRALASNGFADWRLRIEGLVENPLSFSLSELRAMPARTQITRHDCVEGWSCIGKWTGVPLGHVLDQAKPRAAARFLVFYCGDTLDGAKYYESIDLTDAHHPQSILAYDMNDAPLTVAHGAPLRVRLERMLGYKMAKYILRIALVTDFKGIGRGKGGFWEDQGYAWYGGI
jgi:DMSO/TMAO reductase YedYZ molybdopterin-dependent catalytic subunit